MDSYIYDSACSASQHLARERGLAPISGVQGTGLPAAFLSATGMTVAVNDADVRVPPRGRPL